MSNIEGYSQPLPVGSGQSEEVTGAEPGQARQTITLDNPELRKHPELLEVAAGGPPIGFGARGEHIRLLHSVVDPYGRLISDDERQQGIFGRGTENAILYTQKAARLPPTGVIDVQTLTRIDEEMRAREPVHHDHTGGWARFDRDTEAKVVRAEDGRLARVPDHAASARRNLDLAKDHLLAINPLMGVFMRTFGQGSGLVSSELDRNLWLIPGAGLVLAARDAGQAAIHGLAHLVRR